MWRRSLELLQTHFGSSIGSGVLRTLGFLAAALVVVELCSHASVPDHSGNFSQKELLANTEMLLAADAPASVSVVPKLPRSLSRPGSQVDPSSPDQAMTDANADASLFSGETVSSKMLMMGSSGADRGCSRRACPSGDAFRRDAETQAPPYSEKAAGSRAAAATKTVLVAAPSLVIASLGRAGKAAIICLSDGYRCARDVRRWHMADVQPIGWQV